MTLISDLLKESKYLIISLFLLAFGTENRLVITTGKRECKVGEMMGGLLVLLTWWWKETSYLASILKEVDRDV